MRASRTVPSGAERRPDPRPVATARLAERSLQGVLLGLVVALPGSLAATEVSQAKASRASEHVSDIIVVMVDDLGYIADDRILRRLPNIRTHFLEGGLRFKQMYGETPICCPARATLQTGQHTLHHGVRFNEVGDFDTSRTLATALEDVGYHTILAGKYLTHYDGSVVPPGWKQAMIVEAFAIPSPRFWIDGVPTTFEDRFFDDVLRQQAVQWLKEAPLGKPVFQLVTPYAPHRHVKRCARRTLQCLLTPAVMDRDRGATRCARIPDFKPPSYRTQTNRKQYPTKIPLKWAAGWPLRKTCESLLVVDRAVGQLVAAQRERGRPATFIFMSDNGMSWGQHGLPLKMVPWSTRLPFYVAGTGIERGARRQLLSNIDIAVTIAHIAGASMPWADGRSFLPILRGEPYSARREVFEITPRPPSRRYLGWAAIRTKTWRYYRWHTGRRELYDLSRDPWELRNLVKKRSGKATRMERRLNRLLASMAPSPAAGRPRPTAGRPRPTAGRP